mgnify:CR=1 FL=1
MTDPGSTCISSPGDFPFANKEIAGPFVIKERPDFRESIQDWYSKLLMPFLLMEAIKPLEETSI